MPGTGGLDGRGIEVIVRLAPPPLALVAPGRRQLMGVGSVRRLDAASFGSRLYLARLRRVQDAFAARLRAAVPAAAVERRYGVVLDAVALRLPVRALARVQRLPGVADVYPVATYHADTDTVPAIVGAIPLWGVDRSTAGQGVKVAVIDDGIDAGAPFLAPAGMRPPPGFPRGQRRFTSGRVIVARSFAGRDAPNADHLAFDPNVSEHGTHVAGILAGAYGTVARPGLGLPVVHGLSGVAPGAWLGNYRGLARGDHESGAIGSTVELAAAVDRAVADGMDVLNLSLGGPQIDPSADALSLALANAARAGIPSVVAAGNDFDTRGLRLDLLAGHERDCHHGRRDVLVARLRGQRPRRRRGLAGAHAVHRRPLDRAASDDARSRARRASSWPRPTGSTGGAAVSRCGGARSAPS